MSSTPRRTRKKSSVSSCLCQTNSPFTFTTMTSQLLNWATARGDQFSENVASFSDRSILSLMAPSDIVAYEFAGQACWIPPLEPVIGLAEGETRWRGMMTTCGAAGYRYHPHTAPSTTDT